VSDSGSASGTLGGDRMPPLPEDELTPAQRAAAAEIAAGPRGGLIGPFIPALRSPEFMRKLQALGEYLRFRNAFGPALTEFTILLIARRWTQQFEWAMHEPLARKQGIEPDVIAALARGERPESMTEPQQAIYDFVLELEHDREVSDAVYDRVVAAIGDAGVIDLIGTVGYYTTLAMILNVARTPLPDDLQPALSPTDAPG